LHDTEGRRFGVSCGQDQSCKVTPEAPSKGVYSLRATGRFWSICGPLSGAEPRAIDCRPLNCQHNSSCPPAFGLKEGTCINGLCVQPANELSSDDAILLCMAGTGLGHSTPVQVEHYALALNCGQPCRIPKPCRQP